MKELLRMLRMKWSVRLEELKEELLLLHNNLNKTKSTREQRRELLATSLKRYLNGESFTMDTWMRIINSEG